jgi:bacillithiol system protein YtxJ
MTEINWTELTSVEQLDELDSQSQSQPIFFFKHSTRCSISSASLSRLERKWDQKSAGNLKPVYLDLISNREVSNALSEKYGVEHQSPQVLLIKDGKCIYDNSHFGISFDELIEHI